MVAYRRNRVLGGNYFFTVNLKNRNLSLLTDHIDDLREAFKETKTKYSFTIIAVVVLPEHLHTIWQLPENDDDYSKRWQYLKSSFTRKLIKKLSFKKNNQGEYGIWQRRFWEHTIRSNDDMNRHIDYIHYNPVKHGYCELVKEWKYSSFHRFVKEKRLDISWGAGYEDNYPIYGE